MAWPECPNFLGNQKLVLCTHCTAVDGLKENEKYFDSQCFWLSSGLITVNSLMFGVILMSAFLRQKYGMFMRDNIQLVRALLIF